MKSVTDKFSSIPFPLHFSLLTALIIYSLIQSASFPLHDFGNYYFGALALIGEPLMDVYDPFIFNRFVHNLFDASFFGNYSPHPPLTALLFIPFTLFSPFTAKLIFNLLSISFFVFSTYKLVKAQNLNPIILWLLPVIFLIPIRNNVLFGQTYLILTALLIEVYLAYQSKKTWRAAIFLALAVALKMTPLLLLLFFSVKRQFRLIAFSLLILLSLLVLEISMGGGYWWNIFFDQILPRSGNGLVNVPYSFSFQSLMIFLKYLFVFDATYNTQVLFDLPWLFPFIYYTFVFVLLASVFRAIQAQASLASYTLLILALLALTPIGSTYSLILIAFALGSIPSFGKKEVLMMALMAIICWIPQYIPFTTAFIFHFIRVIALISLILVSIPTFNMTFWKRTIFASLIFGSAMIFLTNNQRCSDFALQKMDNVSMMGELFIENEQLKAICLTSSGFAQKTILDSDEFRQTGHIQLNTPPSLEKECGGNIKQVVSIDGETAFILSDYNHGYHFYQLRKSTTIK